MVNINNIKQNLKHSFVFHVNINIMRINIDVNGQHWIQMNSAIKLSRNY
jgi:hypothetical protein